MNEDTNKNSKDQMNGSEISKKLSININNNSETIKNENIRNSKDNKTKNIVLLIISVLITSLIIFTYIFFIKGYNNFT